MVKGVNKTVIEVNNTGSKVFDRIVFYGISENNKSLIEDLYSEEGTIIFED